MPKREMKMPASIMPAQQGAGWANQEAAEADDPGKLTEGGSSSPSAFGQVQRRGRWYRLLHISWQWQVQYCLMQCLFHRAMHYKGTSLDAGCR